MTLVALGPYEHPGAYGDRAESEMFDTSGTPTWFCKNCEHAPCVASGPASHSDCFKSPRWQTADRLVDEIRNLWMALSSGSREGWQIISPAFNMLCTLAAASSDEITRKHTVLALAAVHQNLLQQVQS